MITSQVVSRLMDVPLVIADLSGLNPNVMYELAIRHAVGKPLIQIGDLNDILPFDVAGMRTVLFDWRFMTSLDQARDEVTQLVAAIARNLASVNPVTQTINLQAMRASGQPIDAKIATIIEGIDALHAQVTRLTAVIAGPTHQFHVGSDPWGGPHIMPSSPSRSPWVHYVDSQMRPGNLRSEGEDPK